MNARNLALLVGLPVLLGIALWLVFDAPTAVPTNPQPTRDEAPSTPAASQRAGEPARPDTGERRARGGTPDFVIDAIDARDQPLEPGPPGRIVTGRVAWRRTGEPIANCRVSLTHQRPDTFVELDVGDAPPPDPPIHTYTDRFGDFELPGVPDADALYFLFRLPDRTRDIAELRHPPLQDDVPMWQGDFLLEERGVLTGRVVGIDGLDRGDIEVRAFDELRYDQFAVDDELRERRAHQLETLHRGATRGGQPMSSELRHRDSMLPYPRTLANRHGVFRLEGIRAGRVWLTVNAPGRVGAKYEVLVEPFRTTDVGDVPFGAQQEITVALTDANDAPLVGYQVSLKDSWRWLGPNVTTSDANGEAVFAVPPPTPPASEEEDLRRLTKEEALRRVMERRSQSPTRFIAWARHTGTDHWEAVGGGAGPRIEARFRPRLELRISLHSPLGPVELGTARIRVLPQLGGARVSTDNGVVTVSELPAYRSSVLIQAEGHAPVIVEPDLETRRAGSKSFDVELVPTQTFVVEVFGPSGVPWANARVAAEIYPAPDLPKHAYWSSDPVLLGYTDTDGRLVLPAAWASRLQFHVWHPQLGHYVDPDRRICVDGKAPIRLEIAPAGRLEGELTDRHGTPERRYRVRLARPVPTPTQQLMTRPLPDPDRVVETTLEGSFRITDLRPGEWELTVEDPPSLIGTSAGRSVYYKELIAAPTGDAFRQLIDLGTSTRREPDVHGMLRRAPAMTDPLRISAPGRSEVERVLPAADGTFQIAQLPYGCDALRIEMMRMEHWVTVLEVPLPKRATKDDRTGPVTIDLATGSVTAGLFDAQGRRFAHRMVDLVRDADGCRLTWLTDESGTLQAPAVPVGTWRAELRTVGAAGPQALFGEQRLVVTTGAHCLADLHAQR